MALPAKLESLDGVPELLAKEYVKIDEGGRTVYRLSVEGAYLDDEDPSVLKRAKDHEKKARFEVENKLREYQSQAEKVQEELDQLRRGAIPKGDVDKLEESWKNKLTKIVTEKDEHLKRAHNTIQKFCVDNVAQSIAAKISIAPDLLLPHVRARLQAEAVGDGYETRVLDHEGRPTALSIEELTKELASDKRFAPIIAGSKASGSGASAAGDGRSGAPVPSAPKPLDYKTADSKALAAHMAAVIAAKKSKG